jgi:hypothetical protein
MSETSFRLGNEDESNGGEARIRTLVATGATDLQSVAIDRSATSPIFYGYLVRSRVRPLNLMCPGNGAGEGI